MNNRISFFNLDNERTLFHISILLLSSLIAVLLICHYRRLFGVIEGYAPYEFTFNMLFFLPSLLIIFIGTLITTLKVKSKWIYYENNRLKWFTMTFLTPIILFLTFIIIRFSILFLSSPYS